MEVQQRKKIYARHITFIYENKSILNQRILFDFFLKKFQLKKLLVYLEDNDKYIVYINFSKRTTLWFNDKFIMDSFNFLKFEIYGGNFSNSEFEKKLIAAQKDSSHEYFNADKKSPFCAQSLSQSTFAINTSVQSPSKLRSKVKESAQPRTRVVEHKLNNVQSPLNDQSSHFYRYILIVFIDDLFSNTKLSSVHFDCSEKYNGFFPRLKKFYAEKDYLPSYYAYNKPRIVFSLLKCYIKSKNNRHNVYLKRTNKGVALCRDA